jgi:hypothetical protein
MDLSQTRFVAGIPTEWADFESRHKTFLERQPNLSEAMNIAFIRTLRSGEPIERFVFGYGRLCCEDFWEVLLLATNGYGVGATKLLRTLYEHAVTVHYLNEHPDELNDFYDFSYVTEHKLLKPILETFGARAFANTNVNEAEVEQRFQRVKDHFKITDCKKCGTQKLNHTWNKLDFISMARQTGSLGSLVVPAYYGPLTHAHSSFGALASRLSMLAGGGVTFVPTAQHKEADIALMTAHNIILRVVEIQNARFALPGLGEKLQICFQDFLDIWTDKDKNP